MPFSELIKLPEQSHTIGMGCKMGEGWLLTAEMLELVRSGYENIVCAQPFGCLPNHICGKGMVNKIRELYPEANITPIDYDPSATRVNQENRIKLMLAVARERLSERRACRLAEGSDVCICQAYQTQVPVRKHLILKRVALAALFFAVRKGRTDKIDGIWLTGQDKKGIMK